MPKKFTEQEVKDWLKSNASYIKLLEWNGSGKSKFLDKRRGAKFKYKFSYIKSELKRNPNIEFGLNNLERVKKSYKTNLRKYGCENPFANKQTQKKIKQTNLKRYGTEYPNQNKQIREKTKQTNLKRYGCIAPSQNKKIQEKIKQTNLKKYGVKYNFILKDTKDKIKQTNLKKYGYENPFQNNKIKDKIKEINLKKYGFEYPQQNNNIRKKTKQTNLKKYGFEYPQQNKKVKEKIKQTNIKNGNIKYVVNNKTLNEWAKNENLGCYTTMLNAYKHNVHPSEVKCGTSILELKVKQFLDENNIEYIHDKKLSEYNKRPDFLLFNYNLIIECDGEYYHQDKEKDEKRNKIYKNLGYKVLCFSGQEIMSDWEKVKKQILEKIN